MVDMIYTCTTNPSLDYYIKLDENMRIGEVNRLSDDHFMTGGKGVNVSIELNNLMIPSVATGFLGGFVKEYYLERLSIYHYVQSRFVSIEGDTRINIKLNTGIETVLNAKGPLVKDSEFEKLAKRLDKVDNGDIFILSGNVQKEIGAQMKDIIHVLSKRGVKIFMDTNEDLIRDCLECRPYLIKPNVAELEEICGHIITDEASILEAAKKLIDEGAMNVLVSVGKDGAYFVSDEAVYCHRGLDGEVVSTTGCGDAMVAAYVFNLQRGANSLEAFTYACAAGTATAFTEGMATREDIERIIDMIKIEKI